MLLAHVGAEHAHGAGQVLRLGPLLALALVASTAVLARGRSVRATAAIGAAVALAAAGLLHIALTPDHWRESPAAGVFFVGSSAAELALAAALVRRPTRRA